MIDDAFVERNTVEFEPANFPNNPLVNQPIDPDIEILLGICKQIRRPALPNDYIYLHKSDFNIGQATNPRSFHEVVSCSNGD